ncbi:AZIN2 inhibitor, partial [Amia calva]|nr:AZIN2 inhibitor [Amia calva]
FLVADLGQLVLRLQRWLHALPRARPFYAVKCNTCPGVLCTLAQLGIGFDCASQEELELVLGLGVTPHRIIFAQTCKVLSHLQYAAQHGVQLSTFDSQAELERVARHHPRSRMLLRITTSGANSIIPLSTKFGAQLRECEPLLDKAKELGVQVVGVSFHVGSHCQDPHSFSQAIADAHSVFNLGQRLGHTMTLLDIGGGFPGADHSGPSLEEFAAEINSTLELHFPEGSGVEVIAEPGRYFVTSAFTLATRLIGKRPAPPGPEKAKEGKAVLHYTISDGLYGSFDCVSHDGGRDGCPLQACIVWGPTCSSLDQIGRDWLLPELEVGDWLLFPDHGAYSICLGTNFNGFPLPQVYYTVSRAVW